MKINNNLKNLGVFKDNSDNTIKTVFEDSKHRIIEVTLLFNKDDMDVVCVPSHHFCNLGCKMCHLTNEVLNKKMLPINSEDFIEALIKGVTIKSDHISFKRRTKKKKLLISFMGVGDLLLNLQLLKEIYLKEKYLKDILGYESIGYALATMMPNDISKLTQLVNEQNIPLKLHFSLHTPIDEKRFELIPSTKVTVEKALVSLVNYRNTLQNNSKFNSKYINFHRTNDPIEIHYTLINNVNDGEKELNIMCDLLKKYKIPIKFIQFNPTKDMTKSKNENIWISKIKNSIPHLRVKTYSPPGKEIGSSCGEFTKHYYHEEIETSKQLQEFELWKKKHQIFENDLSQIE